MAIETAPGALSPVMAFALVGALGVGSQWLAWRLRMPAIVLMLLAGIIVGPVLGILDPARDIGSLVQPMIAIAVAIILFEGGLTLNFHTLADAASGVRRLVFIGAPLGWLMSTAVLHYGAGIDWQTSAVFGGIMIVTGPTVIAPLLRQARLSKRPANLLQWEAIVNDPIGALAAVLAFEFVVVRQTSVSAGSATMEFLIGIGFATILGLFAGFLVSWSFKRGHVPEYMKVPVLFTLLLAVFAVADFSLHESGLLTVTIMGIYIANAKLPSYVELRRFKEHATVLLVSGVFILLAANLDFAALGKLDWRAGFFVALVVLVARPVTVLLSLAWSDVPWKERLLVALTGPRGVVLVAVAGLFGERLTALGVEDGQLVGPLAFVLVAATVVLHGFSLAPLARFLGLAGATTPGVIIVGGSRWSTGLAQALQKCDVPVLITDPNHSNLRFARSAGVPTFSGDILSEAAEDRLEFVAYGTVIAATDNDAYNTLVATDLAPEYGRDSVYQIPRHKSDSARHALPQTLGGKPFGDEKTTSDYAAMMREGWIFRTTRLTEEFGFDAWREKRPNAMVIGWISANGTIRFVRDEEQIKPAPDVVILSMLPPGSLEAEAETVRPKGPDALPG